MSKESIIKKRLAKIAKENSASEQTVLPRKPITARPVVLAPRRKLNRRFFILLSIWVIALIAAIYFLTQRG